jgi:hypothetical protein
MKFTAHNLATIVNGMKGKGVQFEEGLVSDEIVACESKYKFHFPPDLRTFLQFALPVSNSFPNWRTGFESRAATEWIDGKAVVVGSESHPIEDRLGQPADGICFDVRENSFWHEGWGERPETTDRALTVARECINRVPRLIPVYGHRFIPAEPCQIGNPVFSVHQSDIIYYGVDLVLYFAMEFQIPVGDYETASPRRIPFWGDLAEGAL